MIRLNGYLIQGLPGYIITQIEISIGMNGELSYFFPFVDASFEKTLPKLSADFSGIISEVGSLDVKMPLLQAGMNSLDSCIGNFEDDIPQPRGFLKGVAGCVGEITVNLPEISSLLSADTSAVGELNITLPNLFTRFGLSEGITGNFNLNIPRMRFSMSGVNSAEGTLDVTLPLFNLLFSNTITGDIYEVNDGYVTMVLNITNQALTEFYNYKFNSYARFAGKNIAAKGDGIYLLEGQLDDDEVIQWEIKLPYLDLQIDRKKRLHYAWIGCKADGDMVLYVTLPDGTYYEYDVEPVGETENGIKVKIGKGIRSRYVGIGLKNADGGSIEMDMLRIFFDITSRPR